ncbi:MAG: hypothetical protein ACOYZ7_01585 [Chloroflexota bacterium]
MQGAKITILGHAYLVLLPVSGPSTLHRPGTGLRAGNGHTSHHLVGKDKVCHTCGSNRCPAVGQVARYLKAGGQRAPEPPPQSPPANQAAPHRLWFVPETCPLCGSPVVRDGTDRQLDSPHTGPRWRCAARGYEHFFQVRYGHLKAWLTRADPPAEPQVEAVGQSCYEVTLPGNDVHIVSIDRHGAVCHTCNANNCAGVRHVRSPEPAFFTVPAARAEPAQVER